MADFFKPLNFTQITGVPHAIQSDAIKKLPTFQGKKANAAKSHLHKFSRLLVGYCNEDFDGHDDVKIKLFVLSLEEDVGD